MLIVDPLPQNLLELADRYYNTVLKKEKERKEKSGITTPQIGQSRLETSIKAWLQENSEVSSDKIKDTISYIIHGLKEKWYIHKVMGLAMGSAAEQDYKIL